MKLSQLNEKLDDISPFKGDAEWVVAFVENGKAKAVSSPSETSAREVLVRHPEGRLYYGHVCLIETQ
jgi:hypothetical protein